MWLGLAPGSKVGCWGCSGQRWTARSRALSQGVRGVVGEARVWSTGDSAGRLYGGVGLGVAPKREASGESGGFGEKERKERDFRRHRQGGEKQRRGGREKEKK
jgi:hypothetical protein